MSYIYSKEYCSISFGRLVTEDGLRSMLSELAPGILHQYVETGQCLGHAEEVAYQFREGEYDLESATDQITDIATLYLDQIVHTEQGTQLVVRSEGDEDHWDCEMAEEIAKHLFAKSDQNHFIWHSVTFDGCEGDSCESIGFRKNGRVLIVDTATYLSELLTTAA